MRAPFQLVALVQGTKISPSTSHPNLLHFFNLGNSDFLAHQVACCSVLGLGCFFDWSVLVWLVSEGLVRLDFLMLCALMLAVGASHRLYFVRAVEKCVNKIARRRALCSAIAECLLSRASQRCASVAPATLTIRTSIAARLFSPVAAPCLRPISAAHFSPKSGFLSRQVAAQLVFRLGSKTQISRAAAPPIGTGARPRKITRFALALALQRARCNTCCCPATLTAPTRRPAAHASEGEKPSHPRNQQHTQPPTHTPTTQAGRRPGGAQHARPKDQDQEAPTTFSTPRAHSGTAPRPAPRPAEMLCHSAPSPPSQRLFNDCRWHRCCAQA